MGIWGWLGIWLLAGFACLPLFAGTSDRRRSLR